METFLPNLLDWDVYSEVVRRAKMIRVCSELNSKMTDQAELIDSIGGDECYIYTHPARACLGVPLSPLSSLKRCSPMDGVSIGKHLPSRRIDRIIGDIIINGRTYCLPSRYYLGGKLLQPGDEAAVGAFGMRVWFDREDRVKLLLEMGELAPGPYEHQMNDAKKKIYDYLVTKE